MKIGLISSAMPLIDGGARFIVNWTQQKLRAYGHEVEAVFVPSADDPNTILLQMAAFRLLKLQDYFERVITFRPPAHIVPHTNKIVWFIHHIRIFYDLWDSPYRVFPDRASTRALRSSLMEADTVALREARRVFTNSKVVSQRLAKFNQIDSEVLYPPVLDPELFRADEYGDEIVCICRIADNKRQHLIVEAMRFVRSGVRLRVCGADSAGIYAETLRRIVQDYGLSNRVLIEDRWISEQEKADRLAHALAATYVPVDEDSYGYPTIEAAHARKCTVTVADAGGVIEFVQHGLNGMVVDPTPQALAAGFDALYFDKSKARQWGEAAAARVSELEIDWDSVVKKLLA